MTMITITPNMLLHVKCLSLKHFVFHLFTDIWYSFIESLFVEKFHTFNKWFMNCRTSQYRTIVFVFFFIYLALRERQYHIKDLFHEQTKCLHINFTSRGKMLVNFVMVSLLDAALLSAKLVQITHLQSNAYQFVYDFSCFSVAYSITTNSYSFFLVNAADEEKCS